MKNKKKYLIIILLIPIYLLVFWYSLDKTNYSYTSPGGINKVDEKIKLESDFKLSGSFNTTYVYSVDHISRLAKDFISLIPYNEISVLGTSSSLLTSKELTEHSRLAYEQALYNSLIVAYTEAGLDIQYKIDKVYVNYIYKQYANTNLEIGDLIEKVNGETFNSVSEFSELVSKTTGDKVIFTLNTNEEKYANFVLKDGKNILGLIVQANIDILSTEVPYRILKPNGLGNSGGFLQTLEMYSILTHNDLTKGRTIAGTGTIELDGSVGAIGGIKEKIVTAVKNDVDIFLCPSVHYAEALEVYNTLNTNMKLVSISNLKEAIKYLEEN